MSFLIPNGRLSRFTLTETEGDLGNFGRFDCFETMATFMLENDIRVNSDLRKQIIEHIRHLRDKFRFYFYDEAQRYEQKTWIVNPFQLDLRTGVSLTADEELIELAEDTGLKQSFRRREVTEFWQSVRHRYPTIAGEALKVLIPFTSSYLCELGFSAMIALETKYRNRLELSQSLRLKLTGIDIDVSTVVANRSHRNQEE